MTQLDFLYVEMLHFGITILRLAVESGNRDWIDAEIELLHNVPSLIGEDNTHRHLYFWTKERPHYIAWTSGPGRDQARSRMRTYYDPIWKEMEPLMNQLRESEDNRTP